MYLVWFGNLQGLKEIKMSHFAKIEPTANAAAFKVVNVIAAEQSFIDSGLVGDPKL